jgi:gephyrin
MSVETDGQDAYPDFFSATDPAGVYKVATSATYNTADPLPDAIIYRINTGGPLPQGSDTVIMVEDTKLIRTTKDLHGTDEEELEVETLAQVPAGENVRNPGSDVKQGDLVLQKGEILHSTGGEIGTLTFVGRTEATSFSLSSVTTLLTQNPKVNVVRKPVVAILSTGNELVDVQNPIHMPKDGWGGIYDTNRPSLQAALEGLGYEVVDVGIVGDEQAYSPFHKRQMY